MLNEKHTTTQIVLHNLHVNIISSQHPKSIHKSRVEFVKVFFEHNDQV